MSNTQIALYLFALLSIYALAAKLDEPVASTTDRPLVRFIGARCTPPSLHSAVPHGHAASGPTRAEPSIRVIC